MMEDQDFGHIDISDISAIMAEDYSRLVSMLATTFGLVVDYYEKTGAWGYHFHDPHTGECQYDETGETGHNSASEAIIAALRQLNIEARSNLALCA